eukprot:1137613-Pelagomonas_calceolata.AAC.7
MHASYAFGSHSLSDENNRKEMFDPAKKMPRAVRKGSLTNKSARDDESTSSILSWSRVDKGVALGPCWHK